MSLHDYGFEALYRWSEGKDISGGIPAILLKNIPGAVDVKSAGNEDDKKGIDYWVYRKNTKRAVTVDVKNRSIDPIDSFGSDDLALERWSVIEQNKIGWTLDDSKETDFILWFFHPTERWVLLPFVQLLAVAQEHMTTWEAQYINKTQSSDDGRWHSLCVFVPRPIVLAAISKRFYGERRNND